VLRNYACLQAAEADLLAERNKKRQLKNNRAGIGKEHFSHNFESQSTFK
jgi:hypothetical protein